MKRQEDIIANKIKFRQLRCFVAVANLKSFVAAADALGLTQPAVSRSIKELESILGSDLFDRSTRGAELSKQGKDFFDAVEAGLVQISQGTKAVLGHLGSEEVIRIGALPNVCSQYLPKLIASFKADFPNIRVVVNTGTNAKLLSALRAAETDLVIGRLSTSDDMRGLVFEALFDEPLIFVVRKCHPLLAGSYTLADILQHPMVLPPKGTIIRQEADRFLAGRNIGKLLNTIETTSSDFQRAYVCDTDAVALLPSGVVLTELEIGLLVDLGIGHSDLSGPVGLTTNPEIRLGEAAQTLLKRIRQAS